MRWDNRLEIPTATTDADPIAAPGTVPNARLFRLRFKESQSDHLSSRVIVGLQAPQAENVSWELYSLDSGDDEPNVVAAAARRWTLVASGAALAGGAVQQSRLGQASQGFVGGGTFYARVVDNNLTTTRDLVFRATV
jgi:hypothetical protein